jgi:hypothetical protein
MEMSGQLDAAVTLPQGEKDPGYPVGRRIAEPVWTLRKKNILPSRESSPWSSHYTNWIIVVL